MDTDPALSGVSIGVDVGRLGSPTDIFLWRASLIPLAVRRSIPLLAMAGVPVSMAERPIGLLGAVRWMLRQIDAELPKGSVAYVAGRGWVDDRSAAAVARCLEEGFERLARVYDPIAASELAGWLVRNEANWAVKVAWWSWWLRLSSVATGRTRLDLPRKSRSRVVAIIDAALGEDAEAAYRRCEEQAAAVPLSRVEERPLRHDIGRDEPPSSADVIISLSLARKRERVRAVVLVLAATLDRDEWMYICSLP